ncbi:C69 family dipeptidase [Brachybacterium sp. ACRRE]|uniref:C69 family dipeptidase n=1 Tax=Brachybacterium sp. ACRRE TaxID=2918184 RepID=UPI001EF2F6C1|nr:C69 family dipeptidase [Brachybacterium sp. ACRRE]MCG7310804.1 C69 family dipeptidase [Brachybacterium sp. ACRRE]
MPCTTLLVGRKASADGSPIVARTEDSSNGSFDPKRVVVVRPEDQPRTYTSVLGRRTIDLPDDPLRYTSVPNALPDEGIWGCAGINAANVAMSATETLTSNPRVLGADPLVELVPAVGAEGEPGHRPEQPGGFGEEDFVTLVLPYIRSAREGVERLGALLTEHGTYEMNGIAFSDAQDIWWLETVGGHHWIARRVPEDHYVTMPNQLGIDSFDLEDAEGAGRDHLASPDLRAFLATHHLDLTLRRSGSTGFSGAGPTGADATGSTFNPREAFGSHTEHDHVYNTPRAWYMQRTLNPTSEDWDAPDAPHRPDSDDLPWSRRPERKLTIEDVTDVLSSHYQGTVFDPYSPRGTDAERRAFRPIGINRHNALAILQIRPDLPEASRALQWISFASNPFNTLIPMFTNVDEAPAYLGTTTAEVSTGSFYWSSRLIAALADAHYAQIIPTIERYQLKTLALGHAAVHAADEQVAAGAPSAPEGSIPALLTEANTTVAEQIRSETDQLLSSVLFTASNLMTNRFSRSDG